MHVAKVEQYWAIDMCTVTVIASMSVKISDDFDYSS